MDDKVGVSIVPVLLRLLLSVKVILRLVRLGQLTMILKLVLPARLPRLGKEVIDMVGSLISRMLELSSLHVLAVTENDGELGDDMKYPPCPLVALVYSVKRP